MEEQQQQQQQQQQHQQHHHHHQQQEQHQQHVPAMPGAPLLGPVEPPDLDIPPLNLDGNVQLGNAQPVAEMPQHIQIHI